MWGWGFLKQMNDTLRYNRELVGKKKTALERQREDLRRQPGEHERQNLADVEYRVRLALKRDPVREWAARIIQFVFILAILGGGIWFFTWFSFTRKIPAPDKNSLFKTVLTVQPDSTELKQEYFRHGPIAAETILQDGLKSQTSTSYYESGQPFRIATYYRDTLISETYFYKSGDTIKNFPDHPRNEIYHITLRPGSRTIHFDLYDGKILKGTYKEEKN